MSKPTTADALDLLTTEELAEVVRVPASTIRFWRTKGLGPRAVKVGKYVRFRRADVDKWLTERTE